MKCPISSRKVSPHLPAFLSYPIDSRAELELQRSQLHKPPVHSGWSGPVHFPAAPAHSLVTFASGRTPCRLTFPAANDLETRARLPRRILRPFDRCQPAPWPMSAVPRLSPLSFAR